MILLVNRQNAYFVIRKNMGFINLLTDITVKRQSSIVVCIHTIIIIDDDTSACL